MQSSCDIVSCSTEEFGYSTDARDLSGPQQLLQQRNYLKNINPRDTANLNLHKAFLEYDKNLYVFFKIRHNKIHASNIVGQEQSAKKTWK